MPLDKLTIGTANFGLPYGTVPGSGQLAASDIEAIIFKAENIGISRFDTAPGYGAAEAVLGACVKQIGAPKVKITSKVPPIGDRFEESAIRATAENSREKLGVDALDALLVHRAADLFGDQGRRLWRLLEQLKSERVTRRIGVSVYSAKEIDQLLRRVQPDIVQLPFSLADQRLLRTGHLKLLAEKGIEIQARSIFAQGVLLVAQEGIDSYFDPVREQILAVERLAMRSGVSRLAACLSFVEKMPEVSQLVVGCNSEHQLAEIAEALKETAHIEQSDADKCAWQTEELLNPAIWPISLHTKVETA